LIEKYEEAGRGLYSGTVGYVDPQGQADFNVVIRSILLDQSKGLLSYTAGGAITYDSDPEAEYEESLLKAKALRESLGG
jgi:para-aminobenzoate synthetase component 1